MSEHEYVTGIDNARRVRLEKVRVGIEIAVSEQLLDAQVEVEQVVSGMFTYRLSGYLMGEKVIERTFSHPADWWQAFKARWFPTWALRRWPVEMTEIVVSAKALYPNFRPSLPREQHFVDLHVWEHKP